MNVELIVDTCTIFKIVLIHQNNVKITLIVITCILHDIIIWHLTFNDLNILYVIISSY